MTTPSSNSHLKNTAGGAFTEQTYGGTIMGAPAGAGSLTKSFLLIDAIAADKDIKTLPQEFDSGTHIYKTHKPLSAGTFAYNAATRDSETYLFSRGTTSLSGVSDDTLLFMGADNHVRSTHEFQGDFGAKLLTAWRAHRFSFTGLDKNGAVIASRSNWMNVALTAAGTPATLSGVFMWDIADGDATDKPADSAIPTRAIPGELVFLVDFVDYAVATSGNNYNYPAITGM
jgi:hypothetical protein